MESRVSTRTEKATVRFSNSTLNSPFVMCVSFQVVHILPNSASSTRTLSNLTTVTLATLGSVSEVVKCNSVASLTVSPDVRRRQSLPARTGGAVPAAEARLTSQPRRAKHPTFALETRARVKNQPI